VSADIRLSPVEPRTCRIGGETRRRGVLGPLRGGVLAFALAAGAVGLLMILLTRSWLVLLGELAVVALVALAMQRRTAAGDPFLATVRDGVRRRVARRTRADQFVQAVDDNGRVSVPREVGSVDFLGVTTAERGPELAIVRRPQYVSTVLEVAGGGDGLLPTRETNAFGLRFGRFLATLARPEIPVDQIDLSTRVTTTSPANYEKWLADHASPHSSQAQLADLYNLAGNVAADGEEYRTFMTVCMPITALGAAARRAGGEGLEGIAEAAFETTRQVVLEAKRSGLRVRHGLTQRQLAGLIRHLYVPDMPIDAIGDLASPRQAFVPYTAYDRYLETQSPSGVDWYHATATVPRDGWPLREVGVRWLEALVTDITPSTIRTVTTQHRLVPKSVMRTKAALALTLDEADLLKQEKRGQVSTGEREAQKAGSSQLLNDLLHAGAAGDQVTLRVTVSAPSPVDLDEARDRLTSAALANADFSRIKWLDGRHHHGHLLTLPLGRGVKR
jgi:type IV secretory pathway TrbD component